MELDEPELWVLEPEVVAVAVEKPEDEPVPVVADPDEVAETAEELPDSEPEAAVEVAEERGTTGEESPAGMEAGAG